MTWTKVPPVSGVSALKAGTLIDVCVGEKPFCATASATAVPYVLISSSFFTL